MGASTAMSLLPTSANSANTTRARRSKSPIGQMKGDTRFTVRQAAWLSLSPDASVIFGKSVICIFLRFSLRFNPHGL
jgi:hypothetical protein